MLDTTRADRLGAWGHDRPTSPALDRLAASGIRFAWHFANSHATRPSMPQLMSGRYYHQNILRTFEPRKHPREFPFSRPARRSTLLPELLRRRGYAVVGVSAHPWVVGESEFGRSFERLDLVPFDAKAGHGDAKVLVDGAIELWSQRPADRPTFLYLHFMDAHMPRVTPAWGVPFDVPLAPGRFDDRSEPLFGKDRRPWSRTDATDYTADDRAHFAAVYDACVAYADSHLGRLLDVLRRDDPDLAHTVVVVTADHGEELGDDGRVDHGDALADAVQHVPWVMAGHGIVPGQVTSGVTEHVDVLPTVLAAAGLPLPDDVRTDGTARLDRNGRIARASRDAAYFAWEDYSAVRTATYLFRESPIATTGSRCRGEPVLYTTLGTRTAPIANPPNDVIESLRRRTDVRLDARGRRFRRHRYESPRTSFSYGADFWVVEPPATLRCRSISADTDRESLDGTGWLWTGRGLALLDPGDATLSLTLAVDAPPGEYTAEVGVVALDPMPWLWGFDRWLRRSFRTRAEEWVTIGSTRVDDGGVKVSLAPETAAGRHVVALRLTPPNAPAPAVEPPSPDPAQQERLRALGYVQ